jgi:hypothetical protein
MQPGLARTTVYLNRDIAPMTDKTTKFLLVIVAIGLRINIAMTLIHPVQVQAQDSDIAKDLHDQQLAYALTRSCVTDPERGHAFSSGLPVLGRSKAEYRN